MSIKLIKSIPKVPIAIQGYSVASVVDNMVFFSGQLGINPKNHKMVSGGAAAEISQILKNVTTALEFLNLNIVDIVKLEVSITNLDSLSIVNNYISEFLLSHSPCISVDVVSGLVFRAEVQLNFCARLRYLNEDSLENQDLYEMEEISNTEYFCKDN